MKLTIFDASGSIYARAAEHAKRQLIKSLSQQGKNAEADSLRASLPPLTPNASSHPDVMPQVTYKADPRYTGKARNFKISGTVVLSLDVDESGIPRNVEILEPLGEGLDEIAMESVQTWKFKPALKNGKPVSEHANVEVNFQLL